MIKVFVKEITEDKRYINRLLPVSVFTQIQQNSGGGFNGDYNSLSNLPNLTLKADLIDGKIPAAQLPGFVDDVIEGRIEEGQFVPASEGEFIPEENKLYLDTETNKVYRYSGSQYVEISESLAIGETSSTAFAGNRGKALEDRMSIVEQGLNSANETVTGIQNAVNETTETISTIQTEVNSAKESITVLQNSSEENSSAITTLTEKSSAAEQSIITINQKDASQDAAIISIENIHNIDISVLLNRIKDLESSLAKIKSASSTKSEIASGQTITVESADAQIEVSGIINTSNNITVKDITVVDASVDIKVQKDGDGLIFNASDEVVVKDSILHFDTYNSAGTKINTNVIAAYDADVMTFEGLTFTGKTYNTIMTTQKAGQPMPSRIIIRDCVFNDECLHNNIAISGWADGCIVDIINCKFKNCKEQPLVLKNFHGSNNSLIINMINCEIDNYELKEDDSWCGPFSLDDRTNQSIEESLTNKPFGKGKVIFNFSNVKIKGELLTADKMILGSNGMDQMLWYYVAKAGSNVTFAEENSDAWPTINFLN